MEIYTAKRCSKSKIGNKAFVHTFYVHCSLLQVLFTVEIYTYHLTEI
jgi:hypothetical protein